MNSSEVVWARRECVSAEVEESLVLLDLDTLLYHSLNRTAAAIWQTLEKPCTASQISDTLCKQYSVASEDCRASVERALTRFKEVGLISPASVEPA